MISIYQDTEKHWLRIRASLLRCRKFETRCPLGAGHRKSLWASAPKGAF